MITLQNVSLKEMADSALEAAGIGSRILRRSHLQDLRPAVLLRLLSQVRRGLRGPMTLLRLHAFADPQAPALVSDTMRLSYGELDRRVNRLAHGLSAMGIGPGDRVGLLLGNGHEFIEATAALSYLNAVAVQIGYRLKGKEVSYILSHSGARALLFHADYEEVVREALLLSGGPARQACLVCGEADRKASGGAFPSYEDLVSQGQGEDPPYLGAGGYGSLMLYTSGTTGRSKGARRDLQSTSYASVLAMIADLPLYRDDRHLVACPLYHAAAPAFAGFVMGLGGCLIIPRHFDAAAIPRLIERERITSSVMVPTMLRRLLEVPAEAWARHDTNSLRWLMSVAAPLPAELARRVEDRFGPILYNMYGATETGLVTLARPGEHESHPGTIGRRLFGNDIRLLDEQGTEVGVGQVGELYVRNGTLVSGYYRDDEASKKAQRDGYFTVGDLASLDAEGYYYLADRKTDMVISAGVNIYPLEVEQRLHQHPAVADCAVIGVPDPEWGESLLAFVVRTPAYRDRPDDEALVEELRRFVAAELADYKRPRRIRFVDEIPRNPTGKIEKRKLRQQAAQEPAP